MKNNNKKMEKQEKHLDNCATEFSQFQELILITNQSLKQENLKILIDFYGNKNSYLIEFLINENIPLK